MGILVQQLSTKGQETANYTFVPVHIRGLWNEYLRRYSELQKLRRREISGLIFVVLLGFLSLTCLMLFPTTPLFATLCLLFAFSLSLRLYLRVRNASTHVYVNVHILHHHLLGKLDVGFCEHDSDCRCAENFRKFVWKEYRISLYGNLIE